MIWISQHLNWKIARIYYLARQANCTRILWVLIPEHYPDIKYKLPQKYSLFLNCLTFPHVFRVPMDPHETLMFLSFYQTCFFPTNPTQFLCFNSWHTFLLLCDFLLAAESKGKQVIKALIDSQNICRIIIVTKRSSKDTYSGSWFHCPEIIHHPLTWWWWQSPQNVGSTWDVALDIWPDQRYSNSPQTECFLLHSIFHQPPSSKLWQRND